MTIIYVNHCLHQLLAPAEIERMARHCKCCLRLRSIAP